MATAIDEQESALMNLMCHVLPASTDIKVIGKNHEEGIIWMAWMDAKFEVQVTFIHELDKGETDEG